MAEQLLDQHRENWGSRAGFVLAAIGSAVGLGNLWGFPYKLYDNGGGAFLIPYVIAMVMIGIPLLIAEFSLGHLSQRATPDAFGRINRKFAFVGWWQIALSFVIITYYAVILAYCLSFLWYSVQGIFTGSLPWAGEGVEGVRKAKDFFFKDYLSFNESFSLGRLQLHIVGALVITWGLMYLCIFRGVKLVSKVVLWTVPIPWLMLLILTIRGLTLDGAIQGLEFYLEPNWDRLANPETWRRAFGQMFFSMSLAFGIMVTYASFLHRKSDLNNNATIIGLADLGTSFIAGLAVFATLGGMAFATQQAGNPVPVEEVTAGGPSLAFVAFPYALAQLPHAPWFGAVFFSSLLLLGIDSAFSITECVLASVVDKTGWSRSKTLIGITLVGFTIGVVYCTQGGLTWLGTFDDFINGTWGIALTALLEALVLGWLFRIRKLREHANERSDWVAGPWWTWTIRIFIPLVMAALFIWSLFDDWSNPAGYLFDAKTGDVNLGTAAGLTLMGIAPIAAILISSLRFKRREDELILPEYADDRPQGGAIGTAGIGVTAAAAVALAVAFCLMADLKARLTGTAPQVNSLPDATLRTYAIFCLGLAGGASLLALLTCGGTVVKLEARTIRTSMTARFGAGAGILTLGLTVGLALALWVMGEKFEFTKIDRDGELSLTAYLIIAVMFAVIFVGLGWCFYRSIKMASDSRGTGEGDEQSAEI